MSFVDNLQIGLEAVSPMLVLFCAIGALIGTAVGVLPGLGPSSTIAMLLPLTFGMDPIWALAMLCGILFGSLYGGSTVAILLKVPGEASSVITTLDGYSMAQKGRAGVALAVCAIGSFIAGMTGTLLLMLLGPLLSGFAINFGPAEYTVLMAVGLLLASGLGGTKIKAFIMCAIGLVLSTIGTDSFSGKERFTFDQVNLADGLDLVPVLMGLIALGAIFVQLEDGVTDNPHVMAAKTGPRDILPSRKDMKRSTGPMVRGSLIGFFISVLPGMDASISSFTSYITERKLSKHPQKFGSGMIEGVAGPESANNASNSGTLVPLLTLGIPGTATMAVLASGLLMYGLTPGPMLFEENPDFVYGLIVAFFISNILLLIINLPLIGFWVKLLKFPVHFIYPLIFVFVIVGGYAVNFSNFELFVIFVFAVLGYLAERMGFPPTPLILGFFLGPIIESSFRQALTVSRGSLTIFFERPISLGLILFAVVILAASSVLARFVKAKATAPVKVAA